MEENKNGNLDEVISEKIKGGIDFIDQNVKIDIPDISHFRLMVASVEEKKRQRLNKETFIFMLSAITILSFEILAFSNSFVSFIIIQSMAVTLLPLAGIIGAVRRKHKKVNLI